MNELPDKLSDLILLAIEDGKKMLECKEIVPYDNYYWYPHKYTSEYGTKCLACFAGAVIFGSLNGNTDKDFSLSSMLSSFDSAKLEALDYVRQGDYSSALVKINIYPTSEMRIKLAELPTPLYVAFYGKKEFRIFLRSLGPIVQSLQDLGY